MIEVKEVDLCAMLRYISSPSGALPFRFCLWERSLERAGYWGECPGRHHECEHNRFQAPSSVPAIYFRASRREVRTGHVALRCKYFTYGNRYVDRVHSTALLATSDSLGLPSGIECNGCCRTFLEFVIDRENLRFRKLHRRLWTKATLICGSWFAVCK